MKGTITGKILASKLIYGDLKTGEDIAIRIDQTLTQDSTGTMVYLQLEAMNPPSIKTQVSVAYIDHNTLQAGFENADDHEFIKSACQKYKIIYSKPGGGICHQVHLERFSKPKISLLGSDSHTPTSGANAALAIGAGGLDVAVAMAKGYYYMKVPKVYNIRLSGKLQPHVNGKDVILSVLKALTVKGGVGYVLEYSGSGVKSLSVTDRATICNMGAELGATTSIFPSDEMTLDFLTRQGRGEDYEELSADEDAKYDAVLDIDLSSLGSMVAKPHSPDNVVDVESEVSHGNKLKVDQVSIGSCTNSSYKDMMRVARILENKRVHPDVSLVISPGSSNILRLLSENGALSTMIGAGARILESACGPCIGMGQAPKTGAISLRSFNRNFKGRSGTMDAGVYLLSPETAALSAVNGYLSNPAGLDIDFDIPEPESYGLSEGYFIYPEDDAKAKIVMGPNIKPFPKPKTLDDELLAKIVLKTGDNITTDDICPSNAKLLPFRSNIPHLATFSFTTIVGDFYQRCIDEGGGIIVGGSNYGQGSSREHAALIPLFLGIRCVIAKSFARIHRSNLINNGIVPLLFKDESDYEHVKEMEICSAFGLRSFVENQSESVFEIGDGSSKKTVGVLLEASPRERQILLSGGYLNYAMKHDLYS